MNEQGIKVGDTVRWRIGGKRIAIVTYVSRHAGDTLVRLDRPLRGSTLQSVNDLTVVKPALETKEPPLEPQPARKPKPKPKPASPIRLPVPTQDV